MVNPVSNDGADSIAAASVEPSSAMSAVFPGSNARALGLQITTSTIIWDLHWMHTRHRHSKHRNFDDVQFFEPTGRLHATKST